VHQLRNPLTALRTFGQLLLRRLGPDHNDRSLVESLLAEERQITRYVDAISELAHPDGRLGSSVSPQPLLLPPLLGSPAGESLATLLQPLLQRAEATAALQGRSWQGPAADALPAWQGDSGSVAEILANLLENAFRYSPRGTAVGLHGQADDQLLQLTVWDAGPSIPAAEREAIFTRGVRGERGRELPGTGLGLALGRDLARSLGGELELVVPPRQVAAGLPAEGNAFRLSLPRQPAAARQR
jgi:signal transduction histidine kinase